MVAETVRNRPLAQGRLSGKTAVITGAAQGFGEGIAMILAGEGAEIVIADINISGGKRVADSINDTYGPDRAIFVETDVTSEESVRTLMHTAASHYGTIDVLISNAGILRVGKLEDITVEELEQVNAVNYRGFFLCAKYAAEIMKRQTAGNPDCYADIIQINSKSGLRGSRANFAYAGSKFGGIGLVQSFALELAQYRIKVNCICPGNYLDGPLWSDPENGLLLQYLNAGKVPGARTVDDVREHYLSQVPMHKGCTPSDISKAILYLIEQTGETGQAMPVTGGQIMLG